MIKARAKASIQLGDGVEANGYTDGVVESMLNRTDVMLLEPYEDLHGNILPEWFIDDAGFGYNWHISWLDIIDTESSE